MGCANSRERRCRHCHAPLSPVRRSISFDVRGRLRRSEVDDACHLVSLKSSTLGSLSLNLTTRQEEPGDDEPTMVDRDPVLPSRQMEGVAEEEEGEEEGKGKENMLDEFSMGLIEAKTWSKMIDEKIAKVPPRTPLWTPPGEPEMINAWELMEGLNDDVSPYPSPIHSRSFSFDVVWNPARPLCDLARSSFRENAPPGSPEPVGSGDIAMAFDPEIIASFRKSLQELSPDHPFHMHSSNSQEDVSVDSENREPAQTPETNEKPESRPKEKVVVYFTSLRGVRKTYEDCCFVRLILKGMGLRIDERDVSMHSGFKDELVEMLGDGACRIGLPRVFAGKKYIGGVEEVRRMHEEGVLEEALKGCQKADDGETCVACGDIRFVPCETCSGSCKVYYEQGEEEEEEECEEEEGEEGVIGFKRCPDCNENGLIRCPICC